MITGIIDDIENIGKDCNLFFSNCCKDRDCNQRNCIMPRCCVVCEKVDYCKGLCEFIKEKCRCELKTKRWDNILDIFEKNYSEKGLDCEAE